MAVVVAMLLVTPVSANAASSEDIGAGIAVAIPGTVALAAYLAAGVLLLGLVVARRRPMV